MVAIESSEASFISVFDRRESMDLGTSNNIAPPQTSDSPVLFKSIDLNSNYSYPKETNFDAISEMDRSLGSISTFIVHSSANFDTSNIKKTNEKNTGNPNNGYPSNHFKTFV